MAELSEAEAAVYDRQLRVWGIEVQKRLNAARILIAGCSGLAAEVAKNIALAGIGSLSLMDDTPCSSADPGNFLLSADAKRNSSVAEVSAAALQEMNPLVKVSVQDGSVTTQDLGFVASYQVVVLVDQSLQWQQAWDAACTSHGAAFYCASSRGTCAYFFANLHQHTYTPLEIAGADAADAAPLEQQDILFPSLQSALKLEWSKLHPRRSHKLICLLAACAEFEQAHRRSAESRDEQVIKDIIQKRLKQSQSKVKVQDELVEEFLSNDRLPAVNAICGGVLANETLKAVSHKGEPINNFFFFALLDGAGIVQRVG